MSMTIKQKVSFEVTYVVDSETQKIFEDNSLNALREFHAGTRKLLGIERHLAATLLTKGLEAAISAEVAHIYKEQIKDAFKNELFVSKLSPVVVRNV